MLQQLPIQLDDDLVLRWATKADVEGLAQFNLAMHSDNPEEPEIGLVHWVHDLMDGSHPTTGPSDFTVVQNRKGEIVSSLNTIHQTWAMEDVTFPVGRPELVATHPDYRRRGLVRLQMDQIHRLGESRGELMQVITGIPWYYRQFGYEMTLDLHGGRAFFWSRPGNSSKAEQERYRIRKATRADIPLLVRMYAAHCQRDLVFRVRNEAEWIYELEGTHPDSIPARNFRIVEEEPSGNAVAYVESGIWAPTFAIHELGVQPGHSWRAVGLYLTRVFKEEVERLNKERKKPIEYLGFVMGSEHPIYQALGRQLEQLSLPYNYYVRIPSVRAFLARIRPILERRLSRSVLAGHTGRLRLNLLRDQIELTFQKGRLMEIASFEAQNVHDGDAFFPDQTFSHVLLGYRTVDELRYLRADCYAANAEAAVLLDVLFPKQPSFPVMLG